jgi:hypothetical protein
MTTEEVIRIVLSAAAGLGLGTFLNNWFSRRWDNKREVARAIGEIVGQLIGTVGSARDQIQENERILAQLARGDISTELAREALSESDMDIGNLVMGARIVCGAVNIDVQPLVTALEEYRTSALNTMQQQRDRLQNVKVKPEIENSTNKLDYQNNEDNLVNVSIGIVKSLRKARF